MRYGAKEIALKVLPIALSTTSRRIGCISSKKPNAWPNRAAFYQGCREVAKAMAKK
jgi:hypothetical protein